MYKLEKRPIPILVPFVEFGKQFMEVCRGIRTTFTGQVKCERCGRWIKRYEDILPINHYGFFGRLHETEEVCRECYRKNVEAGAIDIEEMLRD